MKYSGVAWRRGIANLDLIIASICMAFLIVITFINAILRYFFDAPLAWIDEMQMWMTIWAACYGASALFRNGGHIAIDMIVEKFTPGLQNVCRWFVFAVVCGVLSYLCYTSAQFVLQLYQIGRVTSVMSYPQALIYSSVPIGSAMMLASNIHMMRKQIASSSSETQEEV